MSLITYEDKVALNENSQIADINKVTADDMNQIKNAINNLFPVGFIIEVDNAEFNPNASWGGTWERLKGRVIVGVDEDDTDFATSGLTGGEKEHTLTKEELPNVQLEIYDGSYGDRNITIAGYNTPSGSNWPAVTNLKATPSASQTLITEPLGSGQAYNNMPPYYTAYRWIKTAM